MTKAPGAQPASSSADIQFSPLPGPPCGGAEAAVDAEVAEGDRPTYAGLLLGIAAQARFGHDPSAVAMDDTALTRRIALLTQPRALRPAPSLGPLVVAASALVVFGLLAPRVFAETGPRSMLVRGPGFGFMGPPPGVLFDPVNPSFAAFTPPNPLADYQADIDACYELARAKDANLVIDTVARFELDMTTFGVVSASVPTRSSRTFQDCIETKARSFTFPPPPFLPRPPHRPPEQDRGLIQAPIHRSP